MNNSEFEKELNDMLEERGISGNTKETLIDRLTKNLTSIDDFSLDRYIGIYAREGGIGLEERIYLDNSKKSKNKDFDEEPINLIKDKGKIYREIDNTPKSYKLARTYISINLPASVRTELFINWVLNKSEVIFNSRRKYYSPELMDRSIRTILRYKGFLRR